MKGAELTRIFRQPAAARTSVELTWTEGVVEHWIRFGRIVDERILSRRDRVVSFRAHAVFAFVRWASNGVGSVVSRIDIVRAAGPGEPFTTLPFVQPGGDILLHINGWPKVAQVLAAIDQVEALGIDAADAAPEHWRHVHNRIVAGFAPRDYAADRHRAWLLRKALQP